MTPTTRPTLAELVALRREATPGRWYRYTVGHRSVRQAAGVVTRALFAVDVSPDVRPLMTDLTWVQTDSDEVNIALTGNGPRQTENADFVAAAANFDYEALAAELAALQAVEKVALNMAAVECDCKPTWTERGRHAPRFFWQFVDDYDLHDVLAAREGAPDVRLPDRHTDPLTGKDNPETWRRDPLTGEWH